LEENISKEINGIKIYNLLNKKYLLWNYDSFVYLNDQIHKDINLFEKEFYKLELVLKMNNNLIIADYNDEYQFEQFFIIDANKGNVKDLKLKNEIYFDSYFLGYNKDSVYIVDRKNKQQYEINIKKRIQKKSNSKIYKNNKWENISINKLINKNYSFENEQNLIFFLENKNLYSKYNNTLEYVLLVNNVDKIVFINNMDVYYLKEDSLYNYNMYKGETKLMEYSEWLFNNDKMIYIFD